MSLILKVRIVFLFLLFNYYGKTQSKVAEIKPLGIGDKVPENIWKLVHQKKSADLILIDFWASWCGSCIDAFPEMEELQKHFPDSLEVVFINVRESKEKINERFEKINKYRKKDKWIKIPDNVRSLINVPPTLYSYFSFLALPHHVWIRNDRTILAITGPENATDKNVSLTLHDRMPFMYYKDDAKTDMEIGLFKGILQPAINNLPAVFYSAFMPYSDLIQIDGGGYAIDSVKKVFRFYAYNYTVENLYRSAFGLLDKNIRGHRPLIEVGNPEAISSPEDPNLRDAWRKQYSFSYELQAPLEKYSDRLVYVGTSFTVELNRYFGDLLGIEGKIEKRNLNCLVLIKTDSTIGLTSAGGEAKFIAPNTFDYKREDGLVIKNYPFSTLADALGGIVFFEKYNGYRFVDESGFDKDHRVDCEIKGDISDLENVRHQLKKYGLDIIQAKRELEVLVIKDKDK